MSLFKRISTTFVATADRTVARFENHEAMAGLAIGEASRALAEARTVARRHERAAEALVAERSKAAADIALWTRRAQEHAHGDERTALACLEHKAGATVRAETLAVRIEEHDARAVELSQRVAALEAEHAALVSRKDALAGRETLNRAERVLDAAAPSARRLDETFERWETTVDAAELRHRPVAPPIAADLDARLQRAERDRALREELAALRGDSAEAGS